MTSSSECVREHPGVVARDDGDRWVLGADRPEFGTRHLIVIECLQEKRLELVVSTVDFVDEEDGRFGALERAENRSSEQEVLRKEGRFFRTEFLDCLRNRHVAKPVRELVGQELGVEHLLAVLPLVEQTSVGYRPSVPGPIF
jgi:hypothetical protein